MLIETLARYAEDELESDFGYLVEVHLFKGTDGQLKSFSCLCRETMITLFSAYKMTDSSLSYSYLGVADDGMAIIDSWSEPIMLSAEDRERFETVTNIIASYKNINGLRTLKVQFQ